MVRRENADKVEMIYCWGQSNKVLNEAVRLFNATERGLLRPVCKTYLRDLIEKFQTTFSVKDAPRSGRPRSLAPDERLNVLVDVIETPQLSVEKLAEQHDSCYSTVRKILKENKFHPFKPVLIHEINEDDPDRRMQFCDQIQQKIAEDPEFVKKTCFSDESSFFLNGTVNRHNCRYWALQNPHEFRETHTQFPQKVNVWAGIFNDQIVGPFFINGNLDGPTYLQLLEEAVIPRIVEIIEDDDEDFDPIFQQDGAPPHYALAVRAYLDVEFPGRWIGRRGPIEWPARSPDLTPLDFFLWGHLKSVVYKTPVADVNELKQRIKDECGKITPEMLKNARKEFEARLFHCQAALGAQFEHLI